MTAAWDAPKARHGYSQVCDLRDVIAKAGVPYRPMTRYWALQAALVQTLLDVPKEERGRLIYNLTNVLRSKVL